MPLYADSQGLLTGQFTIPGNNAIPAGAKLVEFQGQATRAVATFVGEGTLTTENLRTVNTTINRRLLSWHGDPLAQTFILSQTEQLAGIDLWFQSWNDVTRTWQNAIGSTNVLVQIRDVNQGLPTLDVLSESLLTPAQITQQMNANGFVRFPMPTITLNADHEYCFVVACNDPVTACAVAGLDEFDTSTNKYVTAQPYQIGVLLSSSNNRTWTAHQKRDLTFRLIVAHMDVADTEKTVNLQDVTFDDPIDHLVILAAVDRPSEECDVVFHVLLGDDPDPPHYTCIENQPFTLDASYSGVVHIYAVLTGTEHLSPTLHRNITVVGAHRLTGSTYISRAMLTNRGVGSVNVSVYYDALLPAGSSVAAAIQNGESGGDPVWADMSASTTTDLGDGWFEHRWNYNTLSQDETRVKLTLTGTASALPRVKNLRMVMI